MRKLLLIYGCCMMISATRSQGVTTVAHAKEISFTTDNDAYLFQKKDAYYTNGFFFTLRTAHEKNGKKIVEGYELGQMIFTPLIRKTASPADIDRPYCGYLFLRFNHTKFDDKHNSVFQYGAGIGEVGNASFGESVQNSYHKLLGYGRFTGWQYQVKNALGADFGVSYARSFHEDSSWIKLVPVVEANLGMNYTNAKLGAYLCIGSFENNSNSALWNARVQSKSTATKRKYELFAYWHPQVILQGYNSTVQGGMFTSDSVQVLGKLQRWMFQHNWGICYAQGRWTTNLELVYQSKEAVDQKTTQQYVSIRASYRLH